MEHCVVLGAGLLGRLVAVRLAQTGYRVSVFEAGGPDGTSSAAYVAAAMLAPLAESAITEPPVVAMGQYSLSRWPELLAGLGQPVFFQRQGTLILWHRQDAAEASRFAGHLERTGATIPGLPQALPVDARQIADLEPALAGRFQRGLLLPDEGQLDNRQLLSALLAELEAREVALHWHSARNIEDFATGQPGGVDWVIDCRGVGAKPEWTGLRGVRGEVVCVQAPEVALNRPVRLLHPRYPIYIAPKPEQVFVIGASEIESEDMSPVSVRTALELLSAAYAVHSGFAEARILEFANQCRPTLPDNLPAIRRCRERVLQMNGLYRHGYLIAPAMLDVVMEILETGSSKLGTALGLSMELDATCVC
jgi:glycine oxidase